MEQDARPNWTHWNACDVLEIWEAVELSLDREPDLRLIDPKIGRLPGRAVEFTRRLDLIRRAADLHPSEFYRVNDPYATFPEFERRKVIPANIRQFFIAKGLSIPEEWDVAGPAAKSRWPWGDYETELLRCLDKAARRYWVNYDPSDPTTAPTNDQVADWLKNEFKLSQNKAQAIATILRADQLPAGPRR